MANKVIVLDASSVSLSPSCRRGKQFREGWTLTRVTQQFRGRGGVGASISEAAPCLDRLGWSSCSTLQSIRWSYGWGDLVELGGLKPDLGAPSADLRELYSDHLQTGPRPHTTGPLKTPTSPNLAESGPEISQTHVPSLSFPPLRAPRSLFAWRRSGGASWGTDPGVARLPSVPASR